MKSFLLTAALVAASCSLVLAQPGSGGPTAAAPAAVPLDGGASLLLAGGIGYALRKLRRRQK